MQDTLPAAVAPLQALRRPSNRYALLRDYRDAHRHVDGRMSMLAQRASANFARSLPPPPSIVCLVWLSGGRVQRGCLVRVRCAVRCGAQRLGSEAARLRPRRDAAHVDGWCAARAVIETLSSWCDRESCAAPVLPPPTITVGCARAFDTLVRSLATYIVT